MQGNQPVALDSTEWALSCAIDYHLSKFNCFACLEIVDIFVTHNRTRTIFCCSQCDNTIYVDEKHD